MQNKLKKHFDVVQSDLCLMVLFLFISFNPFNMKLSHNKRLSMKLNISQSFNLSNSINIF